MPQKSQIMYIEYKGDGIVGPARIGRVTFSKSGQSVYYKGRRYAKSSTIGAKANYLDVETREGYWISGCKGDGTDSLYSTTVEIDDDVREEYWTQIRAKSEMKETRSFRSSGKYSK